MSRLIQGFVGRFKTKIEQLNLKKVTAISFGTFIAVEIGDFLHYLPGLITCYGNVKVLLKDFEEGGGNTVTEYIRHYKKERERRKTIGTGVGPGLAWFYYANYLKFVIAADLETDLDKHGWFEKIERSKLPMKLYTLIPRKCYVDLNADDNIEHLGGILIEKEKEKEIQLYTVMDGETKYYCMCDCPNVLKTINHVNDIQMAGIARSKYTSLDLPWNRNSIIHLFTDNTKRVQLMRFYYALNSFLSKKINNKDPRDTARILLFNESDKKPSEVLLQAIKEDLNVHSPNKNEDVYLKKYTNIEDCDAGCYNFESGISKVKSEPGSETGNLDTTNQNLLDWGNMPFSVDADSQKSHSSLMEKNLLSPEENKDVLYNFDVFVTHRRELTDKEKKQDTIYSSELKEIYQKLMTKNMKVLFEKDCLGKDWLTKLKYAATKCRWLVFIDTTQSNSKLFTSHKLTDSIHHILESKKVQTVAIINPRNDVIILDDLNWVTCIPYKKKKLDILYNVVSGADINLLKLIDYRDLYHKPGDVAIGLAWDYAANHLSKMLPGIPETMKRTIIDGKKKKLPYKPKLYIGITDSCEHVTSEIYTGETPESGVNPKLPEFILPCKPWFYDVYDDGLKPGSKEKSKGLKYAMTLLGESPRPVDLIRQMRDEELLTDAQMKAEVKIFCQTVDRIIEILLPEKIDDYEFVYYNDKKDMFYDVTLKMHLEKMLLLKFEHFAPILSTF